MNERWSLFKNRVACSRPGLAYAALRGWPIAYKMELEGRVRTTSDHARIVRCVIRKAPLREPSQ